MIAGVLAGVGLYGVLATAVRQRTAEIGVRMALGAERERIFQLVVGQGFRLSAIGVGIGLIAAFGLTRMMHAMLVGVTCDRSSDLRAMAILFLLIGVGSSWLPARRAAGLDPRERYGRNRTACDYGHPLRDNPVQAGGRSRALFSTIKANREHTHGMLQVGQVRT